MFKPCIEEGQTFTGHESLEGDDSARIHTRSFGQENGDSGCNSGEDSDDSGKGALLDNETATSSAIQVSWVALFDVGVLFFFPSASRCVVAKSSALFVP